MLYVVCLVFGYVHACMERWSSRLEAHRCLLLLVFSRAYLMEIKHGMLLQQDGATPLFWACARGHVELVRVLLNVGSDAARAKRNANQARVSDWRVFLQTHGAFCAHRDVVDQWW